MKTYTEFDDGEKSNRDEGEPLPGDRLRILIVEDDKGTRETVANWIANIPDFELVGEFASARTAIKRIEKIAPDIVLVDINMPRMSGIEFVAAARASYPTVQFLMLTVYGDTDHIFHALEAGASGYLLKSTLRNELAAAIREVHEGGSPMTSDVARKVVQSFHRASPSSVCVRLRTVFPWIQGYDIAVG